MGASVRFKKLKKKNPDLIINLMGCLVGVRGAEKLKARLPYVDVFSPPSDPGPLISHLTQGEVRSLEDAETARRFLMMDDELVLPAAEQGKLVSAHVPVVYGCSHACTFCIIPSKRGGERSRPVGDIVAEVRSLAKQGVKEVTLLGQIVDRYGKDVPDGPNLAALLRLIHEVEGIERIRFLTSHPNYFGDDLIQAIAELPRVMPHIELPIQAGDDEVLVDMKRGYTQQDYRDLVAKIRQQIPDCSIATDIIVGFPGETEEQFMETYRVLADLKLDVAHLARYSVREGTVATRRMDDNITEEEKMRRFRLLEDLQEEDRRRDQQKISWRNCGSVVRGKGQTPLEGTHPHQQNCLRRDGGRPARKAAPRHRHMDGTVVNAGGVEITLMSLRGRLLEAIPILSEIASQRDAALVHVTYNSRMTHSAAIIGGGPAGLMCAEVLIQHGVKVDVYDSMPSLGRKFLMAGRGGLNLTHSEPFEKFISRYGKRKNEVEKWLKDFTPDDLREWARGLGVETFVGTSGRVFPEGMKTSPLLRAWLKRLTDSGVEFHLRHRWVGEMDIPQG